MWRLATWLVISVVAGGASEPLGARQTAAREPQTLQQQALQTAHRSLQASVDRIASGSSLWREALETIRLAGGRVLIVTPDQVAVMGTVAGQPEPFDESLLAEVMPMADADGSVRQVVAVINVRLMEQVHRARWSVPQQVEADLDRVLIHEVYGHAMPYLIAGNLNGRCADPKKGEPAPNACAIQRENAVRTQLGLGRRTDSGLESLVLSRRGPF